MAKKVRSIERKVLTADQYDRIVREAADVEQLTHHPGWKVIEKDLHQDMERIATLLAENRLRTITETITTSEGTKTFTTVKEEQVAENAGMYKQCQQIFRRIQAIISAPAKIQKQEADGLLTVEKKGSK